MPYTPLLSAEVRFEATRVPCGSIVNSLIWLGVKGGVNGLHPELEQWREAGGGGTHCLLQEESLGGKVTLGGGEATDPPEHQLCFEAGDHLSDQMNLALQTRDFTEAEVTLINSIVSLSSSLNFPGHQNC